MEKFSIVSQEQQPFKYQTCLEWEREIKSAGSIEHLSLFVMVPMCLDISSMPFWSQSEDNPTFMYVFLGPQGLLGGL